MWFRLRKEHEAIKAGDYCGKFEGAIVPNVFKSLKAMPGVSPITNNITIGMSVTHAKNHFGKVFEFFETSKERPQPLFEEFKFLNDELFDDNTDHGN